MLFIKKCQGNNVKKDEMGGACGMHKTAERWIKISDGKIQFGRRTLTWKDNIKISLKNRASEC
jgi:hypothetical protein